MPKGIKKPNQQKIHEMPIPKIYQKRMQQSSPEKTRQSKKMFVWRGTKVRFERHSNGKEVVKSSIFYWDKKRIGYCSRRINSRIGNKLEKTGMFLEMNSNEIYVDGKKNERGIINQTNSAKRETRHTIIQKMIAGNRSIDTINIINKIIGFLRNPKTKKADKKKLVEIMKRKAEEIGMPEVLLEKLKSINSK